MFAAREGMAVQELGKKTPGNARVGPEQLKAHLVVVKFRLGLPLEMNKKSLLAMRCPSSSHVLPSGKGKTREGVTH